MHFHHLLTFLVQGIHSLYYFYSFSCVNTCHQPIGSNFLHYVALFCWMMQRSRDSKLHQETTFLGVTLLDQILSRGFFKAGRHLQILGIACLTLATRIEENQSYSWWLFFYLLSICVHLSFNYITSVVLIYCNFNLTSLVWWILLENKLYASWSSCFDPREWNWVS